MKSLLFAAIGYSSIAAPLVSLPILAVGLWALPSRPALGRLQVVTSGVTIAAGLGFYAYGMLCSGSADPGIGGIGLLITHSWVVGTLCLAQIAVFALLLTRWLVVVLSGPVSPSSTP